jgi:AraC-like DNA-binding protein
MIQYVLETTELNVILQSLNKLFGIRITFFDMNDMELDYFDIRPLSDFCGHMRKKQAFNKECIACDYQHLARAKSEKKAIIYRCHSNLYEGIIPLYDKGKYFGSLVFGQVRPLSPGNIRETLPGNLTPGERKLYSELPEFSLEYLRNLADLLGRLSEYIVIKELVKYQNQQWALKLRKYIQANINRRISIADLAGHIGKSVSFISHLFRNEFGLSPGQFIISEKINSAKKILSRGASVRETALELGFYDEFHFSRTFRKKTGISPAEYKKQPRL